MRTETEEIRDNLKYLSLLARDYPSQAAAASEIISTEALLKLPKGYRAFYERSARRKRSLCTYPELCLRRHPRKKWISCWGIRSLSLTVPSWQR